MKSSSKTICFISLSGQPLTIEFEKFLSVTKASIADLSLHLVDQEYKIRSLAQVVLTQKSNLI